MNDIEKLTKDCPREDCSIETGISTSTCMGWSPTYDKHGNRNDSGDPNIYSSSYRCTVCGRGWTISQQGRETRIHTIP